MPKSSAEKESASATKILQSFLKTIPPSVLRDAHGLAIFSGVRGGMYLAGSGGSGVVVARLPPAPDSPANTKGGSAWSPPSAFSVRSGSVGLVYGLDVYDCVAVLNTPEAVAAYFDDDDRDGNKSGKVVMGGGISVAAGPLVSGSVGAKPSSGDTTTTGDGAPQEKKKAVYTYTKSKGLYGGVTVDGTVIKANRKVIEAWYGVDGVKVEQILGGKVKGGEWPAGSEGLKGVLERI